MNKCYYRIVWENYPSENTPINEQNLNKIDVATDEMDNRIITLDTEKATKIEVSELFKGVEYDDQTGIITFTRKNGATVTIDTPMEKIATGIYYNPETEKLVLPLIDGTSMEVDLSRLMKFDEFIDSDTIAFSIKANGTVTAIVKEGSIEEKHLRPDYLADIKVEAAKAQISSSNAANSETNAKNSEEEAKKSENNAANSETMAAKSAQSASTSAMMAENSATIATQKATDAENSAQSASKFAANASKDASDAEDARILAQESEILASDFARQSQSYAMGTGNVRPNESTDNAKYYYEQTKSISESFSGALRPMGTVTFANLPSLSAATEGDMYNISDQFTTNANFKEGAGNIVPAGANVYRTTDGYWDVLAGTPVTGIKGNAEQSYRKGNVNLTPGNIGALSTAGGTVIGKVNFKNEINLTSKNDENEGGIISFGDSDSNGKPYAYIAEINDDELTYRAASGHVFDGDARIDGELNVVSIFNAEDELRYKNEDIDNRYLSGHHLKADYISIGRCLDDISWAEIKADINAGNVNKYHVGDWKQFTIPDVGTFTARIAGINTYSGKRQQSGYLGCHIDWITDEVAFNHVMNTTSTNNGDGRSGGYVAPYLGTEIHSYLGEIFETLPSDLQTVISIKQIYMEKRYSASGILTSSNGITDQPYQLGNLWLPTEYEVFGAEICGTKSASSAQGYQEQYPLFRYWPRFKQKRDILANPATHNMMPWWLWTTADGSSTSWLGIGWQGNIFVGDATNLNRIPICFRIKTDNYN